MKFKKMFPIIAMLMIVLIAGCTKKDDIPGVSPTVTSTNPKSDATSIGIDSKVSAIFSVAMDPSTIIVKNFSLLYGTTITSGTLEYDGSKATFTPAENLSPNTSYTATFTTGVKNESGITLAKSYIWNFTTGGIPDTIKPVVVLTDPLNNALGVSLSKKIVVKFSEPMAGTSLNALTFILSQDVTVISGAVTFTDTTATFTPSDNLLYGKLYTGTITTGAKDLAGNALTSNYTFSFTTLDAPDIISPVVNSNDPLVNATDVPVNKVISLTFSEAMDPLTINAVTFTLKKGTTDVPGTVSYSGTTATFTPTNTMDAGAVYTATITTGAKDLAGNALAANTEWSFTTVGVLDTTSPAVTLTDPLNNVTNVALNKTIVLTFSESMDPLTITSATFTLKKGTTDVPGTVSYSGTTATFTPTNTMDAGAVYTATITTGAKDLAGNALAANTELSFTTVELLDTTSPVVILTDPLNNVTNVALNKTIVLTFSESMDPLTITTSTFTLEQGTTSVAGAVSYSGTTAIFTPSDLLAANTIYTARITTGAKDLAGNSLAANTELSFTTVTASAGQAVVELGAAANYVILAKTAINNNPISVVTGDMGLSPAATSYITGFALTDATGYATCTQVVGQVFAADMAAPTAINLTTAVENMITAYNDAAGRSLPDFLELGTGNIGGKTLTPGLYKWTSTVTMPSDITISGGANDVWIFQISGDLSMSSAVRITLSGGAQAKNIFWQVAGEATIGTTAHFEGIILSMTGITFQTGASMNGRALAQTAVVLDGNAITKPQ